MFDQTQIADMVARWPGLGIKLPKELATAIEVFEAVRYTEVGYAPVFRIEELTPANADAKIRELAEQLLLAPEPGAGLSVLERAKKTAVDAAARRVNNLGRHFFADAVAQLSPEFSIHAEAYVNAVARLPENVSSDTLLNAGPDAVAAYGEAQREAKYLDRISEWVAQSGYLFGVLPKDIEVVLRVLRPESGIELAKLDDAHQLPANQALQAIDPVFFTAARLGVPFGINSAREAAQIRKSLTLRQVVTPTNGQRLSGRA